MNQRFFITGIGTGVGKTVVSAIVAEAMNASYWKPIQAGASETDSDFIRTHTSLDANRVFPESYKLNMPASPHIAAREEGLTIEIQKIVGELPQTAGSLIIEGAGGLMVPLNDTEFVADLVKALDCKVILVSRNYLGSINHSLLTSMACKEYGLNVAGWIFNDQYLDYESEIANWTNLPVLGSVPYHPDPDRDFIFHQSGIIRQNLQDLYG